MSLSLADTVSVVACGPVFILPGKAVLLPLAQPFAVN